MKQEMESATIEIRIFGALRTYMDNQGLPYLITKRINPHGRTPLDIAHELKIPTDKIEAVFCNGKIQPIDKTVFPGDRIAFLPYGTPGPYRVFLGIVKGKKDNKEKIWIQ